MARPTKEEMLKDPDFYELEPAQQKDLMGRYDPNFKNAASETQDRLLKSFSDDFRKEESDRQQKAAKMAADAAVPPQSGMPGASGMPSTRDGAPAVPGQGQQSQGSWLTKGVTSANKTAHDFLQGPANNLANLAGDVTNAGLYGVTGGYAGDVSGLQKRISAPVGVKAPSEFQAAPTRLPGRLLAGVLNPVGETPTETAINAALLASGPVAKGLEAVPALGGLLKGSKAARVATRIALPAVAGAAGGTVDSQGSAGSGALQGLLAGTTGEVVQQVAPKVVGAVRRNMPGAQQAISDEMGADVAKAGSRAVFGRASQSSKPGSTQLADLVRPGSPGASRASDAALTALENMDSRRALETSKRFQALDKVVGDSLERTPKGWTVNISKMQEAFNTHGEELKTWMTPKAYGELKQAIFRGADTGATDVVGNLRGWLTKYLAPAGLAAVGAHTIPGVSPVLALVGELAGLGMGGLMTHGTGPTFTHYAGRKPLAEVPAAAQKVIQAAPYLANVLRKAVKPNSAQ